MYSTGTCALTTVQLMEMAGDMEGARAGWQGCVVIGSNGSCRFLFPGMPRGLWDVFGRTLGVQGGETHLEVGSQRGGGGVGLRVLCSPRLASA